jgi:hypothetical protein
MLTHLQQRVIDMLAKYDRVTFVTCGPAGPQASLVNCRSEGMALCLHVPMTSDHLFNLEHGEDAVALTEEWELRGEARVLSNTGPEAVVEFRPARLQVFDADHINFVETIDIDA